MAILLRFIMAILKLIACNSKLPHSDSINGYTTISRADVYVFESLNNLVPISNHLECNFN